MADHLNSEQDHVITILLWVCCALGIAGSLFIIVPFLLFKDLRHTGTRLIFCLSLADLGLALSWFPVYSHNFIGCVAQAVFMQYFQIAVCMWTFWIACTLYAVFIKGQEYLHLGWWMLFHIIGWGLPLMVTSVYVIYTLFQNHDKSLVGQAGSVWCEISDDLRDLYRLCVVLPVYAVCIILTGAFYLVVSNRLGKTLKSGTLAFRRHALVLYFLALFLCQLPVFLNRIQNFLAPHSPIFALYVMHAAAVPLQGFVHGIVYGFNEPEFVDRYTQLFTCCCCSRSALRSSYAQIRYLSSVAITSGTTASARTGDPALREVFQAIGEESDNSDVDVDNGSAGSDGDHAAVARRQRRHRAASSIGRLTLDDNVDLWGETDSALEAASEVSTVGDAASLGSGVGFSSVTATPVGLGGSVASFSLASFGGRTLPLGFGYVDDAAPRNAATSVGMSTPSGTAARYSYSSTDAMWAVASMSMPTPPGRIPPPPQR